MTLIYQLPQTAGVAKAMFKDLGIPYAISATISAVEKQENKTPTNLNSTDQVIYMKVEAHSSLELQME